MKRTQEQKIDKGYAMAGLNRLDYPKIRPLFIQVIAICDKAGMPIEEFDSEFREIGSYIKSAEWKSL